jgi:geranylgeranyl pyrophosphate synthase
MDYQQIIETKLIDFIPKNTLDESIKYSLLGGGKRFRGSLCYLTANIFNADLQKIHSSSCALEMIHAYSLIHDDLPAMDDDDTRRGKPTSHKKFDEATAILAGDGLQTLAFKTISEDKNLESDVKIKLLQILTNASFDMVLGQKLDIDSNDKTTLKELENINQLKTGALLKASVLMGGIIAKVDEKTNDILSDFANFLAKAYQVQDDCFDDKSDVEIGKTNNSDKTTFATILGTEKATKHYQELYDNALKELQKIDNSDNVKAIVLKMKNRKF